MEEIIKERAAIKHCTGCDKHLSIDKFYDNKTTTDGFSTYCKKCSCARARATYRKKRDAKILTELTCTKCKVIKPIEEFNKNKNAPTGRQHYCRACQLAYNRATEIRKRKALKASVTKEIKETIPVHQDTPDNKTYPYRNENPNAFRQVDSVICNQHGLKGKKNWVPTWIFNLITK